MQNLNPGRTTPATASSTLSRGGIIAVAAMLVAASAVLAEAGTKRARLSSDLTAHLTSDSGGRLDVIVTGTVESVDRLARRYGIRIKKFLSSGAVLSANKQELEALAADGEFGSLSGNAIVRGHMAVTTAVTGAQAAWAGAIAELGPVDGRGIGVAIIDSGIADHPALKNRVVVSVDFTDPTGKGLDLHGHGTHVAGIVAARDFNNHVEGADSGMAPAAHLVNLKVLGADGTGEAANVIEAIDWAIKYRKQFGIRVLNLSLGAAPTQTYKDDPICQAVERAVKAGLVVVAAAGNYGENDKGQQVYGSVTTPGISPHAITVGALRTQGTVDSVDDELAPWSSKGPTLVDHIVKPDLVAPGSRIVSTAVEGSTLSNLLADRFINGPGSRDYMAMSGTSMAAAVVSGAVALMLDGRTDLNPVQVKLALQQAADFLPHSGLLASGAGALDLADLNELQDLAPNVESEFGFAFTLRGNEGVESQVIVWMGTVASRVNVDAESRVVNVWAESLDVIVWAGLLQDVIVWMGCQDVIVWMGSQVIVWMGSQVIVWMGAQDVIVWMGSQMGSQDVIVWMGSQVDSQDVIVWMGSQVIVWM